MSAISSSVLLQRWIALNPALKTLPTPLKPKAVTKKKERISKTDLDCLKRRAQLHVRELISQFFPDGRLGPSEQYWITPELRISLSTGCFWRNEGSYSRGSFGDVLTLFLIGNGYMVPEKRKAATGNHIEDLKARLLAGGPYHFREEGAFQRGVQSLSEWLEQFPSRAEVHELVGYDS
jgi:hypothetical protein